MNFHFTSLLQVYIFYLTFIASLIICITDSQWVGHPSVGPLTRVANANQRKPGSVEQSRNFIH